MAKTRWTKKKKKRTKPLKDITSPLKKVPQVEDEIPKLIEKENEMETNPDEEEENENEEKRVVDGENEKEPFLLRAVDNLTLCVIWPVPGFCIPMKLLAFEAITKLGAKFREPVEDVDPRCPRIRRSKLKRSEMKGFTLSKINKELGNTKVSCPMYPNILDNILCYGNFNKALTLQDIVNILVATDEEETLLGRITEPAGIRDKDDVIVESWMKRLASGYVVRFEDILEEDVAARKAPPAENVVNETGATNEDAGNMVKLNELVEMFKSFKEDIGEQMKRIEEKVEEFDIRLAASEAYVHEQLDAMSEERGVKRTGTTIDDNSKRPTKRYKNKE
ncbi:hypothetical protein Bca4012_064870 [Brassica carinata]